MLDQYWWVSIMLIDCYSNYLDGRSFIESSITKPYANKFGILGSMMGNTMIQQPVRRFFTAGSKPHEF